MSDATSAKISRRLMLCVRDSSARALELLEQRLAKLRDHQALPPPSAPEDHEVTELARRHALTTSLEQYRVELESAITACNQILECGEVTEADVLPELTALSFSLARARWWSAIDRHLDTA